MGWGGEEGGWSQEQNFKGKFEPKVEFSEGLGERVGGGGVETKTHLWEGHGCFVNMCIVQSCS